MTTLFKGVLAPNSTIFGIFHSNEHQRHISFIQPKTHLIDVNNHLACAHA